VAGDAGQPSDGFRVPALDLGRRAEARGSLTWRLDALARVGGWVDSEAVKGGGWAEWRETQTNRWPVWGTDSVCWGTDGALGVLTPD
jgi:hypothetical protein